MESEFATITTAIDNRGYCVCKVSGLGKLTNENGTQNPQSVDYSIPNALCAENSVTVFIGKEGDLDNEYDKEVLRKMEEIVKENESNQ